MRTWPGLAALLLAILGLAVHATAGPLSERIFFVSNPIGIPKIYVVRPDGKDLHRLTRTTGPEAQPAVSLAAGKVAYRGGNLFRQDLYMVNLDGRHRVQLTNSPAHDRHPSWSPDGKRLVFSTDRWGQPELALLVLATGRITRLTWDQGTNTSPVWSPTGKWIAFVSYRNGLADIYAIGPSGKRLRRLTHGDEPQVDPNWSPDGTRLVFQTLSGPRQRPSLGLVDLATDSVRPLNVNVEEPRFPTWSPDGSAILVAAGRPGHRQLKIIDLATGTVTPFRLAGNLPVRFPVWTSYPLPWGPAVTGGKTTRRAP